MAPTEQVKMLVESMEQAQRYLVDGCHGHAHAVISLALSKHFRAALAATAEPATPTCPGPNCKACSGEACDKCGKGSWNDSAPTCEHGVVERHEKPATPTYSADDLRKVAEAVERSQAVRCVDLFNRGPHEVPPLDLDAIIAKAVK